MRQAWRMFELWLVGLGKEPDCKVTDYGLHGQCVLFRFDGHAEKHIVLVNEEKGEVIFGYQGHDVESVAVVFALDSYPLRRTRRHISTCHFFTGELKLPNSSVGAPNLEMDRSLSSDVGFDKRQDH